MFKSNDQLELKIQEAIIYYNVIAFAQIENFPSFLDYRNELMLTHFRIQRLRYKQTTKYKCFRLALKLFGKRIVKTLRKLL